MENVKFIGYQGVTNSKICVGYVSQYLSYAVVSKVSDYFRLNVSAQRAHLAIALASIDNRNSWRWGLR